MDAVRLPLLSGATSAPSEYERAVAAHARHYVALVEGEGPRLDGAGKPDGGRAQKAALLSWGVELNNILEALVSATTRSELAWLLPLARYLQVYWDMISGAEPQHRLYAALAENTRQIASPQLEAHVLSGLGRAQYGLGNMAEARKSFEAAQTLAIKSQDRAREASSLLRFGAVEYALGNYGAMREPINQALAILGELADHLGEAKALLTLSTLEFRQWNYSVAREQLKRALAIFRELGNCRSEATALSYLSYAEANLGNDSAAREMISHALAIQRELGDRWGQVHALTFLGIMDSRQGSYDVARQSLGLVRAISRDLGNKGMEAYILHNLGIIEYKQENYSAAVQTYSQALPCLHELDLNANIAETCACAGSLLAALQTWPSAATVLFGSHAASATLGFDLDPQEKGVWDEGRTRLDAAVAAGEVTAEDLAQWQAQGEALSLDELAEFTLRALAEHAAS